MLQTASALAHSPDREEIVLNDEEDVLFQICRDAVIKCQCPRYMNTDRILERKQYIDRLAKEYNADGIIVQQMKFCNFWGYERADYQHVLPNEYGWPVLSIDRAYSSGAPDSSAPVSRHSLRVWKSRRSTRRRELSTHE